jgi:cytoskeletal protein CcmA (bactofilin family)
MKHTALVIAGLGSAFFMYAGIAQAGPIIRGGETVSIDAAQALQGDFYGFGSVITLSGTAEYDAHLLGGTVTVNAPVQGDLSILGGSVQIHSDIKDDLRIVGGEVTLGGTVTGDIAVVGGVLTILSTAQVKGDILFFGGSLVVEGPVTGMVHGYADSMRINAAVGGIEATVAQGLTLHDKAHVEGDVMYTSMTELSRAQNAVVTGDIHRRDMGVEDTTSPRPFIMWFLSILFMAASLFLVARAHVEGFVREAFLRIGQHGLIGLGIFLVIPFISVILLVSVVGIPLGIMSMTGYIAFSILAFGLATIFLGYCAERLILKHDVVTARTLFIGVLLSGILSLVPFGFFILCALTFVGMGTLGASVFRFLRG